MILFVEKGRLGNQLFQYAALRSACSPAERLILIGFTDLENAFENVDATFVFARQPRLGRMLQRARPALDSISAYQPLIGVASEATAAGTPRLIRRRGIMKGATYARVGYFQSEGSFDASVVDRLRLRRHLTERASATLAALGLADRKRIFVHVRRGDYHHFPAPEAPALLPTEWYEQCMERMREQYRDPIFVVCSDDPDFITSEFGGRADVHVSSGDTYEDFAIMCQCDGGILSPSSYAWWAAWFAHRRAAAASFLAPEYWIGHPTGEWYPPAIRTSFISYVSAKTGASAR